MKGGAVIVVLYEFQVAGGTRYVGTSNTSDQSVIEGSIVCILYDPEKPDRNTPYLSACLMWPPFDSSAERGGIGYRQNVLRGRRLV